MRAMEAGVGKVRLSGHDVTLNIEALAGYSGQGRCRALYCFGDNAARYKEDLSAWAQNRNWEVTEINGSLYLRK